LKIRSIQLTNWGPFEGVHSIHLDVSAGSPVVVVHGENGRGKTSTMRSLFWCLYGTVRDGYGYKVPTHELVNNQCCNDGQSSEFGVQLIVEFDAKDYEISRTGKVRQMPDALNVESEELSFRPVGEHPYSESKSIDMINLMLEEAIADFYLFDGEKLASVEKKLNKNDSDGQQFVQRSVERALGLSFADRLMSDIESVSSGFSDAISGQAKLLDDSEKLVLKKQGIEADIENLASDKRKLVEMRASIERARGDIANKLQDFDLIRDRLVERQLLEADVLSDSKKLDEKREELRHEADSSWYWPISKKLDAITLDLEESYDKSKKIDESNSKTLAQLHLLESNLSSHSCSLCGAEVDESSKKGIESRIKDLHRQIGDQDFEDPIVFADQLRKLSGYREKSKRFPVLEELVKSIANSDLELLTKKSRILELGEQIGSVGNPDILMLENDKDKLTTRISESERLEEQVDAKISTERSSLKAIQLKIQESPDLDPVERKKLEISDALDQILRESYDEFRENMRLQVEAASSNILLQLSSEVEYQKVSISPKYQVAMLDTSHQVLPSPSSGYSQILALAFIGGLADVAGSDNFVVMDTPWGRVDRGNRKLIMKWIRERSNQTIIFVQSGELTPSEAREHFGNKMGRQLSIVRQGPNSSKIEEI